MTGPYSRGSARGRAIAVLCVILLVTSSALLVTTAVATAVVTHEKNIAVASAFRLRAAAEIDHHPRLALQYAIAAYRLDPTRAVADDLRRLWGSTYYGRPYVTERGGHVDVAPTSTGMVTAGLSHLGAWLIPYDDNDADFVAAPFSGGRLAVSPTGLAFVSGDTTSSLWDIGSSVDAPARLSDLPADGRATLRATPGGQQAAAFSPDGRLLAIGGQQEVIPSPPSSAVTLWSMTDPQHPQPAGHPLIAAPSPVTSVAFSADGTLVAAGGADGTTAVWNLTDPTHLVHIAPNDPPGHDPAVTAVAFAPQGRTLAIGRQGGTVSLWDTTELLDAHQIGYPLVIGTSVLSLAFNKNGAQLAVGGNEITVLDLTHPAEPTRRTVRADGDPITSLLFIWWDDGSLITSGDDGTVTGWSNARSTGLSTEDDGDLADITCLILEDGLTPAQWSQTAAGLAFEDTCDLNLWW